MLNALLALLTLTQIAQADSNKSDKQALARATIGEIGRALDQLYADCGRYPLTKEGLTPLLKAPSWCAKHWGPHPYLQKIPRDPWGRPYIYQSEDGSQYKLQSLGADGKEGGTGENWDLISGAH